MKPMISNKILLILTGTVLGAVLCFGVLLLYHFFFGAHSPLNDNPNETLLSQQSLQTVAQISTAQEISSALYAGDYKALSARVSPDKGLTVVPFSTVETGKSITFTPSEVREIPSNKNSYIFGVNPDNGEPVNQTPSEFFQDHLRRSDFSLAPVIGINRVVKRGNAVENVDEAFPGCVFIDLYYPPTDTSSTTDWVSLKVVLEPRNEDYTLVALVRSIYTLQ